MPKKSGFSAPVITDWQKGSKVIKITYFTIKKILLMTNTFTCFIYKEKISQVFLMYFTK